MVLVTPECFEALPGTREQLTQIFNALTEVVDNTGGASSSATYTSNIDNAIVSGSIPAGVYGWSITVLSGTATVNGESIPVNATVSGGGYGGRKSTAAIAYTIVAGNLLISYDN